LSQTTENSQPTESTVPSPALVQRHLRGVHFPASRDDLLSHVRDECARVTRALELIPDQEYRRASDVKKAFREHARDYVSGAGYPARRDDLVEYARDAGAGPAVIEVLTQLPDNTYDTPDAVVIGIIDAGED
jgi:hypothetical protein